MADPRSNVVPKFSPLTEMDFKEAWLGTLSRLCQAHGEDRVALWLGVGLQHLRKNIRSGNSLPTADKLWNLLAYDQSAHDELDGRYGLKNVGCDDVCSSDPLTLSLITLARDVAEAEAPDSPGGHTVTDTELRGMDEGLLRKVHRVTGTWLERLEEMRRPRVHVVGGRA